MIPSETKPSLILTYQKPVETLIKVALVDIITEWEWKQSRDKVFLPTISKSQVNDVISILNASYQRRSPTGEIELVANTVAVFVKKMAIK